MIGYFETSQQRGPDQSNDRGAWCFIAACELSARACEALSLMWMGVKERFTFDV